VIFRKRLTKASWIAKKAIDSAAFIASGMVTNARDGIRLLGQGEIKAKVTIHVAGASASAKDAVEKAGGSLVVEEKATKTESSDKESGKS